jgi:hypothetical protein
MPSARATRAAAARINVPLSSVSFFKVTSLLVNGFERLVVAANGTSNARWRGPLHPVRDDAANDRMIIGRISLMPWTEIEDFTLPATEGAAASEYFPAFEPAYEDELVRCWNVEVLAIHFLRLQLEELGNPRRDRVGWIYRPDTLLLVRFAPLQVASGSHQLLEDFGEMAGVQYDKPHAVHHSFVHACDDVIVHFVMCHMPPPDKYVRVVEHFLCQSMLRLRLRCRAHCEALPFRLQAFRDDRVNAVRIYAAYLIVNLLVLILIPYGNSYHRLSLLHP